MFRRAKLYILSCVMEEERKTDLILFIWLKLRSHVIVEFFNMENVTALVSSDVDLS